MIMVSRLPPVLSGISVVMTNRVSQAGTRAAMLKAHAITPC